MDVFFFEFIKGEWIFFFAIDEVGVSEDGEVIGEGFFADGVFGERY